MFGKIFQPNSSFRTTAIGVVIHSFKNMIIMVGFLESGLLGILQSFSLCLLLEFLHVPYSHLGSFA